MAAPAEKKLPPFEKILLAHPLLHAAEGELYRRVFVEATAAVAARPARTPADALVAHIAKAIDRTPANVVTRLAVMGKASGKPWAADQKNAALAAWLALATSRSGQKVAAPRNFVAHAGQGPQAKRTASGPAQIVAFSAGVTHSPS
jgi:hypothetical protein